MASQRNRAHSFSSPIDGSTAGVFNCRAFHNSVSTDLGAMSGQASRSASLGNVPSLGTHLSSGYDLDQEFQKPLEDQTALHVPADQQLDSMRGHMSGVTSEFAKLNLRSVPGSPPGPLRSGAPQQQLPHPQRRVSAASVGYQNQWGAVSPMPASAVGGAAAYGVSPSLAPSSAVAPKTGTYTTDSALTSALTRSGKSAAVGSTAGSYNPLTSGPPMLLDSSADVVLQSDGSPPQKHKMWPAPVSPPFTASPVMQPGVDGLSAGRGFGVSEMFGLSRSAPYPTPLMLSQPVAGSATSPALSSMHSLHFGSSASLAAGSSRSISAQRGVSPVLASGGAPPALSEISPLASVTLAWFHRACMAHSTSSKWQYPSSAPDIRSRRFA